MAENHVEMWNGVSLGTRLSYATGHVLNDICASMWFTYLLVYFNFVLGFGPTESGIVLLIGQVADALSTPFVGYHSDKPDDFALCKMGRRKAWHLIGTTCTLFAFPFIFANCLGCETSHKWAQLFYYAAFVIIFQFGWASVQISHLSLIPELTPNEHERTQLTALRYSFTVFSNVLVYLITWWSLGVESDGDGRISPSDSYRFRKVVWAGLAVGCVANAIFHSGVHEKNINSGNGSKVPLRPTRSIRNVLSDQNLYMVAVVYMSTRLFVNLSQVVLPLYLHETLGLQAQSLAILPLTVYLSSFGTSLIVHALNKYCGRKFAFMVGVIFGIIACIWIRWGGGSPFIHYEIYGVAILLGIAGSILLVTSLGLTADLIGADTDRGAFVYGLMSFSDKLSSGLAVFAIQHLHATVFTETYYYGYVLSYVCGASAVMGLISIMAVNNEVVGSHYTSLQDSRPLSTSTDSVHTFDTPPNTI